MRAATSRGRALRYQRFDQEGVMIDACEGSAGCSSSSDPDTQRVALAAWKNLGFGSPLCMGAREETELCPADIQLRRWFAMEPANVVTPECVPRQPETQSAARLRG